MEALPVHHSSNNRRIDISGTRVTLSVCLIVKDEERVLGRCLSAAVQIADELIVMDTGSNDRSVEIAREYTDLVFCEPWQNSFASCATNHGVAWVKNRLLKDAKGEWIHLHDSDDWVYTDLYDQLISALPATGAGADIICMDLEINDGTRLPLNGNTQRALCAQISRFIRRSFVEDITFPEQIKAGDDRYFAEEMLTHDPRTVYSGVMAYHYNYPREGSLFDLQTKGLISQTTVSQNPRPEQV
ncbi:MAG: glycosyltransferase [Saccharofermentans sp.]|nr:glycosyltransferase [Saccharofermentans sp.]